MELRRFAGGSDYERVSDFLVGLYQPGNRDGNWFQPIWEYAYTLQSFDEASIDRIGIWEDKDRVVGVVTYEVRLGEAFFQIDPGYDSLRPSMLAFAEENLIGSDDGGQRYLKVFVSNLDSAFESLVASSSYKRQSGSDRPMSQFSIRDSFPPVRVPDGFRLQSLADENNLRKVHRVLHRGFNHPGEPPEESIVGRRKNQSGPHFQKGLQIVAVAPNGDYVSYGGMWYDETNQLGYVEPVATDPDYRRRGLGTAVVLEGIRRCGALGATAAYVGSDKPFYLSMGFRKLYTHNCWVKHFDRTGSGTPRD